MYLIPSARRRFLVYIMPEIRTPGLSALAENPLLGLHSFHLCLLNYFQFYKLLI